MLVGITSQGRDMAAEFKKDPVLILRMDGEDLREYAEGPQFEADAASTLSTLGQARHSSLRGCLAMALEHLSVDHGMPPCSDRWVYGNIVEPALQSLSAELDGPISQEIFAEKFRELVGDIARRLHEHPVIVAHSENTFDGGAIRGLLSNNFELSKLLDAIWVDLTKDMKAGKDCLLFALGRLAAPAELPQYGTNGQVDAVVDEVIGMAKVEEGKMLNEQEFKKAVTEVLESISLRLGANPISVSTNLVIDEPLVSSSPPTPD